MYKEGETKKKEYPSKRDKIEKEKGKKRKREVRTQRK